VFDLFEDHAGLGLHYSDWENVRVRVSNKDVWNLGADVPVNMVVSRHSTEEEVAFLDKRVTWNSDNHPVVFSALGSHAHYLYPGVHYYERKKELKYLVGTVSLDLMDFADAKIMCGIRSTGNISTGTAKIGGDEVYTTELGDRLLTYKWDKHKLVSSAWPEVATNAPDWYYFVGQWGGIYSRYLR
jgi:hypothetical protein